MGNKVVSIGPWTLQCALKAAPKQRVKDSRAMMGDGNHIYSNDLSYMPYVGDGNVKRKS